LNACVHTVARRLLIQGVLQTALFGVVLSLPQQSIAARVYATKSDSGRTVYTNVPFAPNSQLLFSSKATQKPDKRGARQSSQTEKRSAQIPEDVLIHIDSAAAAYDIESSLISAIIRIESGFNQIAVSPKGARGLMQLMPDTAKRYGATDLYDVRTNIFAGTAYLRDLLVMFDGRIDLALAGYNAGENAVRKYKNSVPPYPETKHYVTAVLGEYRRLDVAEALLPTSLVLPLLVAMPRLFGFWIGISILASNFAPLVVRNGLALAVALFAYPITSSGMPALMPNALAWSMIIPKEMFVGYLLGFVFSIVFWAFENAGNLIDIQSGTNNASMMDPTSNTEIGPTGLFAKQIAITLFVAVGMLDHLAIGVVQSFALWPWHQWTPNIAFPAIDFFLLRSNTMWQLSVQIAAPFLLTLVCLEFSLGLINRVTQQFDVYSIGTSLKVLTSVLVLAIAIQFWVDTALSFISSDFTLLTKLLSLLR
jgi:type III secretion protein T